MPGLLPAITRRPTAALLIGLLILFATTTCFGAELHNRTFNTSFHDSDLPFSRGCSREATRSAREILLNHVYWFMHFHGPPYYADEPKCPWNLERDMFILQESLKEKRSRGRWVCTEDGHEFENEYLLDKHLDKYHSSDLIENGICLAEYCDILKCDWYKTNKNVKKMECRPAVMQRLKMECRNILNHCFPKKWGEKGELYWNTFNEDFCEKLKCKRHPRDPSKLIHLPPPPNRKSQHFWSRILNGFLLLFIIASCGLVFVSVYYCNGDQNGSSSRSAFGRNSSQSVALHHHRQGNTKTWTRSVQSWLKAGHLRKRD